MEEGQAQGAPAGLAAQDLDFVISDEKTLNTAVVIPITKDQKEELHFYAKVLKVLGKASYFLLSLKTYLVMIIVHRLICMHFQEGLIAFWKPMYMFW